MDFEGRKMVKLITLLVPFCAYTTESPGGKDFSSHNGLKCQRWHCEGFGLCFVMGLSNFGAIFMHFDSDLAGIMHSACLCQGLPLLVASRLIDVGSNLLDQVASLQYRIFAFSGAIWSPSFSNAFGASLYWVKWRACEHEVFRKKDNFFCVKVPGSNLKQDCVWS